MNALVILVATLTAHAPPPKVALQGALKTPAGLGVDGNYDLIVSLYDASSGGVQLWTAPYDNVAISEGVFSLVLDAGADLFDDPGTVWLGVRVENEPELPRTEIVSNPLALVAEKALGVSCAGCIGKAALSPDVIASIEAGGTSAYTDPMAVAAVLEADLFLPKGTAILASMLPFDGLDEVSGGMISTTFPDTFKAAGLPTPILDNNPLGASATIEVPNVGIAETFEVRFAVAGHSNVAELKVTLYPPDASSVVLFDKGNAGATGVDYTMPTVQKPVSGDLSTWVGKNIQGSWHLEVVDGEFDSNGNDGTITAFEIKITTVSNKKLHVTGDLHVDGFNVRDVGAPKLPGDATNKAYVDASFKDRVYTEEVSQLAPGQIVTVTHGKDTNLVFADAWFKDLATGLWSRSAGSFVDASVGDGSDGDFKPTSNTTIAGKSWQFKTVSIPSGVTVTVTGTQALVIKAQASITIAGKLALDGLGGHNVTSTENSSGGAGGGGGGATGGSCPYGGSATDGGGAGAGKAAGNSSYGGGGGGAGHASNGFAGSGGNTGSMGSHGQGGAAYNSIDADVLAGGSGGGAGGYGSAANSAGGGGGGGGGAVKLVSPFIDISGTVTASGGAGGNVTNGRDGGGGGGGAGGALWFVAEYVKITGVVKATGGIGGVVDKDSAYGGDGGAGSNGRVRMDATSVTGSSNPPYFKGTPLQGYDVSPLRVFQPDASSVSAQNLALIPLDVKLLVIVP